MQQQQEVKSPGTTREQGQELQIVTTVFSSRKLYPSRSQIAPFYSVESAICDRGHYISGRHVKK
jgi:hypothetical protein